MVEFGKSSEIHNHNFHGLQYTKTVIHDLDILDDLGV